MALQFLGETGVYLPKRDAIKFTAIGVGVHIDCYVTRSALQALGCRPGASPSEMVERFERNRLSLELAAMIKYRRSTASPTTLQIGADDLRLLEPSAARLDGGPVAARKVAERSGTAATRP